MEIANQWYEYNGRMVTAQELSQIKESENKGVVEKPSKIVLDIPQPEVIVEQPELSRKQKMEILRNKGLKFSVAITNDDLNKLYNENK